MEHCRAAERALVAALVLGQADPAELSGRVRVSDFTDPAAGLVFETVLEASRAGTAGAGRDLPQLLRARGALRGDGYPVRELLEWLPTVPVPAHPEPWAALVVAGALSRLVWQCGARLHQVSESVPPGDLTDGAGRVLAFAVAQRASVQAASRRWAALPPRWRRSVPPAPVELSSPVGHAVETWVGDWGSAGVERELLGALVAAPKLLERLGWLHAEDFTDPACGAVFTQIAQLHRRGTPVDRVTLSAVLDTSSSCVMVGPSASSPAQDPADEDRLAEVCRSLEPCSAFPAAAEFLARQIVSTAVIRHASQTGHALSDLAVAPASTGGLGGPMLQEAQHQLQRLAEHGERWHQARAATPHASPATGLTRSGPRLALIRTGTLTRTVAPEPATAPMAGQGDDRTAG